MPVSFATPSPRGVFFCVFATMVATFLAPKVQTAIPGDVTTRNFFGQGTSFNRPTVILDIPGFDSTYLVLEQTGGMVRMEHDATAWTKHRFDSVYVTGVNGRTNPRGPGEGNPGGTTDDGGLMGFAFHPNYGENRKYYVKYVDPAYPGGTVYPGTIVIAERLADSTLLAGSNAPQRVILAIPKPYIWHSGGTLRFAEDGYLYTAIGDGGSGGDPGNRAQTPGTLHGKMLRIDVDGPDAFPQDPDRNYAIPQDNPFVGQSAYYPEIWATGLRSPWRWDFEPNTRDIWLGDVGQSTREKVTRVPEGGNLGWKMWEGFHCFSGPCSWDGMTRPVLDLPRSESVSVSGGTFFEGEPGSPFDGLYIFGDYGTNRVWAMRVEGDSVFERSQIATVFAVVSFHKDYLGRLLAVGIRSSSGWNNTGTVQILESPYMLPAPPSSPPVRLARGVQPRRAHGSGILASDVRRDPSRYEIRGLDGRRVHGVPTGTVWVRLRGSDAVPQLVTVIR